MKRCQECGSWMEQCASEEPVEGCGCARCLFYRLLNITAERDALLEDAERYRWLKSLDTHNVYLMDARTGKEKCVFVYVATHLDSAIDAIRKEVDG